MTHDYIDAAALSCDREKVPYVFAMRSGGDRGDWLVTYNLAHHPISRTAISKREDMLSLLRAVLLDDDDEP